MARENLIAESVAELQQLLTDEKIPEIGQIALSMNGMGWRCIHQAKDHVVLMMTRAYDWRPFARPDKEYWFGWNNYEHSQIRRELNTEVLDTLFGEERGLLLEYGPGMGKLFLLSDEEVGFEQTDSTFDWFRGHDEDELDSKRSMKDMDGDKVSWWLRGTYPSYCDSVRLVITDGSLYGNGAFNAYGLVAACVIPKQSDNHARKGVPKLMPCPFCGGKAILEKLGWPHRVYCEECGARVTGKGYAEEGEADAIRRWNARTRKVNGSI